MRFGKIIYGLFSASIVAISVTTMAHAQASSPAGGDQPSVETNDIVVTAQRREQRLQDVPIAVSVVSGSALESQGLKTLPDVMQRMTNVKLVPAASSDVLQIRGVGSGANVGFEQSVATFVDGIYRSRSRSIRSALFDIERVELLKGPQSTFFGNNAIAGALNITTRKPGDRFAYNGSALYSPSDGEYIVEAGADIPLADTFSVRVAGQASGMNGYIHNDFLGNMEPHPRDYAGRISAVWKPTDNFRSDIRLDHIRMRDRGAFSIELINCPTAAIYGVRPASTCARYIRAQGANIDGVVNYRTQSPESNFSNDMTEIAWVNRLDLNGATLTATTGYFHHNNVLLQQTQPFPLSGADQTATPVRSEILGPVAVSERFSSYSQELRWHADIGILDLTLGAYLAHSTLKALNDVGAFWTTDFAALSGGLIPAGTPVSTRNPLNQKDTTMSVFTAATLNLAAGLRVNMGLRYSSVEKEAHRQLILGTSGRRVFDSFVAFTEPQQASLRGVIGIDPRDFADPKRVDEKFMPSASIQYELTPRVTAYASYSTGFKAGGFGIGNARLTFEPETVKGYEIGLKGSPAPGLFFTAAAFLANFSKLQVAAPTVQPNGTVLILISNAAKAESKGIELGATWEASPLFSFRGDIGYLHSTYQDFKNASCTVLQNLQTPIGCSQDLSGRPRAFSPKWTGSFGATLSLPVGKNILRIEPNVYVSSKFFQQDTIDPLFTQGGYAKWDLRLGLGPEDRRWEFAIIGKNLSDKLVTGYKQSVGTSPGAAYTIPERPRSIAFQLSIKG